MFNPEACAAYYLCLLFWISISGSSGNAKHDLLVYFGNKLFPAKKVCSVVQCLNI